MNSASNTDTTLRARLSKSRLLSPPQHLPIYILSLFTWGLLCGLLGFWPLGQNPAYSNDAAQQGSCLTMEHSLQPAGISCMLVFAEGGKPENPQKNPQSRVENPHTQRTYGVGSGNRTWATLVGSESPHHYANPTS